MPPPRARLDAYQKLLLDKMNEVGGKVDESLRLGRENGEEIRSLRKELGIDGNHGRLPILEQAMSRLDRQQENDNKAVNERLDKMQACIENLESGEHHAQGKRQFWQDARGFLGGSAGAALIAYLAKLMGFVH